MAARHSRSENRHLKVPLHSGCPAPSFPKGWRVLHHDSSAGQGSTLEVIKREQDRANGPGSSWDRDFVQQPHLILSLGRNCILVWIDTKRIKPLPLPPRSTAGTLPPTAPPLHPPPAIFRCQARSGARLMNENHRNTLPRRWGSPIQ